MFADVENSDYRILEQEFSDTVIRWEHRKHPRAMSSHYSRPQITIYVRDFTSTSGMWMIQDGPHSGEEFRDKHLLPKFQKAVEEGVCLNVILEETKGYASSFLEVLYARAVERKMSKSI